MKVYLRQLIRHMQRKMEPVEVLTAFEATTFIRKLGKQLFVYV